MRFFLKKSIILKSSTEIDYLFKTGTIYKGVLFDIIFQPKTELRVMFAVSKKVKNHVQKNKVKRLLREMFRLNRSKISGSYYIVIIAKQLAFQSSLFNLDKEFQTFICKALR